MGSSGGGGGGNPNAMFMNVAPMKGLPVAGADSNIGSAYEYGKFQNFLPDIKADGPNDMATGLRPEMFEYRSPGGAQSGGGPAPGGGNAAGQVQQLRDALAAIQAGQVTPPPAPTAFWPGDYSRDTANFGMGQGGG